MVVPLKPTWFVYPISYAPCVARVREPDPNGAPKPRLLDRGRAAVRARHYSRRTEEAYVAGIRRYTRVLNRVRPGPKAADRMFLS